MADPNKMVFISYRRSVSAYIARAIFQDLRKHRYDVFMDVENVDSGTFDTIILGQIAARPHFIVILTPGSVDRCDEPGDWLRTEIEYAVSCGRNIVPVLANEFSFEESTLHLTGKLSELQRYNGLTLHHDYFDEGMTRLRKRYLKQPASGQIQPTPVEQKQIIQQKIDQAASEPTPTEEQLTAEQYFERGHASWEAEEFEAAIDFCTQAIRLNPHFAEAYLRRGAAHYYQRHYSSALDDYEKAIELNPSYAAAYHNRALIKADQGDTEGALDDLKRAIHLNNNFALSFMARGELHEKLGNYAEAIKNYRRYLLLCKNQHCKDVSTIAVRIQGLFVVLRQRDISTTGKLSIETVEAGWREALEVARNRDVLVGALLSSVRLAGLNEDTVELTAPTENLLNKLMTPRNKVVAEQILEEAFQQKLAIHVKLPN